MYLFEGENYKTKNKKEEVIPNQFIDIKRQKGNKSGTYDIDKYYQDRFNKQQGTKEKKKLKGW